MRIRVAIAALLLMGPTYAGQSQRVDSFTHLGFFLVPNGGVAEIIGATPDARTLVYANSALHRVGFVDISDPESPELLEEIAVEGEPTSVTVSPDGEFALVALQTTAFVVKQPPVQTPGKLLVLRMADASVAGSVPLGVGPDSVAVTEIGSSPPTRSTVPDSRARRSFVCSSVGISVISSRNSVPPQARSKCPVWRRTAPVKLPRSWPKSSLSISMGDTAPQLRATKGPATRGLSE